MEIKDVPDLSLREFSKRDLILKSGVLSTDVITAGSLQRIADILEKIERHMAYNNGTLEGLTRNFDPNINRK